MQVTATYLIQTNGGTSWDTDQTTHTAALAYAHKKELVRDCDYHAADVRIVAFIGGEHGNAADAWEEQQQSGKPCGRKAMARLVAEHGLAACAFLTAKESVSFSVGCILVE